MEERSVKERNEKKKKTKKKPDSHSLFSLSPSISIQSSCFLSLFFFLITKRKRERKRAPSLCLHHYHSNKRRKKNVPFFSKRKKRSKQRCCFHFSLFFFLFLICSKVKNPRFFRHRSSTGREKAAEEDAGSKIKIYEPSWLVEMTRLAPTASSTAIRPAQATRPLVPSLYESPDSDQVSGV